MKDELHINPKFTRNGNDSPANQVNLNFSHSERRGGIIELPPTNIQLVINSAPYRA
jgi:hypothetical protein